MREREREREREGASERARARERVRLSALASERAHVLVQHLVQQGSNVFFCVHGSGPTKAQPSKKALAGPP